MIGGGRPQLPPARMVGRYAWALWKHGAWVLLTLGVMGTIATLLFLLAWLLLNLPFMLMLDGWTFERAIDAFSWLAPIWVPLCYGWASTHLTAPPSLAEDTRAAASS